MFTTTPTADRKVESDNFYQFLLRALLRDFAHDVEHYMLRNEMVPLDHRGRRVWSKTADCVYVLRLLRNGFNHGRWVIGTVHRDVNWNGIVFKQNFNTQVIEGWRKDDPILGRLPKDRGAIEWVGDLIVDVVNTLAEATQIPPAFESKSE